MVCNADCIPQTGKNLLECQVVECFLSAGPRFYLEEAAACRCPPGMCLDNDGAAPELQIPPPLGRTPPRCLQEYILSQDCPRVLDTLQESHCNNVVCHPQNLEAAIVMPYRLLVGKYRRPSSGMDH